MILEACPPASGSRLPVVGEMAFLPKQTRPSVPSNPAQLSCPRAIAYTHPRIQEAMTI